MPQRVLITAGAAGIGRTVIVREGGRSSNRRQIMVITGSSAFAEHDTHAHSPRTTVGAPQSRVIAGPHAVEMTDIRIGRIKFAQARIVGGTEHAREMVAAVAPAPAVADAAVMAGMPSR